MNEQSALRTTKLDALPAAIDDANAIAMKTRVRQREP